MEGERKNENVIKDFKIRKKIKKKILSNKKRKRIIKEEKEKENEY